MGDHIVRRGAAGTSRRSEPRPTAELSERELHGLLREHDAAPERREELEPELELAAEAPLTLPSASSPRMLAHTMRRAPSPDGLAPPARGSIAPRGPIDEAGPLPIDRTDISTIEMPRIERGAASDPEPFPDEFRYSPSDEDPTRLMHHRLEVRDEFDESIPPAENDFEADCAGMDPPFATAPGYLPRAVAEDIPRVDRELTYAVPEPRPSIAMVVYAPASRAVRVLTITLAFLVAAGAGYLLIQSTS
jgi:hypothetical protein